MVGTYTNTKLHIRIHIHISAHTKSHVRIYTTNTHGTQKTSINTYIHTHTKWLRGRASDTSIREPGFESWLRC